MIIGVPKEIKRHEYRVALTPEGAAELTADGHRVLIERSAGIGSGFADEEYTSAGAEITDKEQLFGKAGLILKVKEPLPEEYPLMREGLALFTFLHLAPNTELVGELLKRKIFSIGYETLEVKGRLPLLTPMSEIAGRMSPLVASYFMQKAQGGAGILPTGAPGVRPANILIIGAGSVGTNAAKVAHALGMRVTVLNRGIEKLAFIDELLKGGITTLPATSKNLRECVRDADIVIGAVLVAGVKAPICVTREMLLSMKKGSVVVDVSIDQGGCIESSKPTTHDAPVYQVEGIVHYAVTNMPGAYPRTSTLALTNMTLPYIKLLAGLGPEKAIRENPPLRSAVNTYNGMVVHGGLAASLGVREGTL